VMLMLAALGTAFYMSRLYFLVFSGSETRASDEIKHHIHESPGAMVGPLVVLAIGAALGGFIGLPGGLLNHPEWNLLADRLAPVLGPEMEVSRGIEVGFMVASVVLALAGIGLAYLFYGGGYRQPARKFASAAPRFVQLVRDKFRIDELYGLLIIRPLKAVARFIFFLVDRILIDKILVEGSAAIVDVFGRLARAVQGGDVQRYMAVFAIGAAGIVYLATRPSVPDTLKVTVSGLTVDVDAHRGSKPANRVLDYSFDFDDDGKPEVTGAASAAHHVYPQPGTYTVRVKVKDPSWGTSSTLKQKVEVR